MLVCAPTGSGKTMAFLIPILHHIIKRNSKSKKKKKKESKIPFIRNLVLSPTKELAQQVTINNTFTI